MSEIIKALKCPKMDGSLKREVALKKLSKLRLSCLSPSIEILFLNPTVTLFISIHAKGKLNALANI
jgi:hypothetical protein